MKKCPAGQYYCFTDKKCKKIPMGYHVGGRGMLEKDTEESEAKKNGNGNGNGNGSNGGNGGGNGGGMGEQVVHEGGTLHKWFKGSKSKDGKGGWVNVVTGGTCASDKPGEGTPKCVSSAKRASMTKAERLSAARRKKKADPGQQQKSGAAKPTYVKTDSPRKMKEETTLIQEKDKKGKGSGTKDACYHKVKSRYSVWPSAYASGALVKCRKVGAANWGNKSEGLSWDELTEKFRTQYGDKTKLSQSSERKSLGRKSSTKDGSKPTGYESPKEFRDKSMPLRKHRERFGDLANATEETSLDEKCWPGYEKKGMKTMFGKRYPNCVKKKATRKEQVEEATRLPATTGNIIDVNLVFRGRSYMLKMFFPKVGIPSRSDVMDQIEKVYPGAKLTFFRVSDYEPGQPIIKVTEHREREEEVTAINETSSVDSAAPGEFTEETEGTLDEALPLAGLALKGLAAKGVKGAIAKTVAKKVLKGVAKTAAKTALTAPLKVAGAGAKAGIGALNTLKKKNNDEGEVETYEEAILEKTAAWTRKAGKNKEGGLNEKGRKSYERENPGSDLKAPSKKVGNKRRASFCARMKGMKKKLTSSKTANDPGSRINKSLRAWNC